MSRYKHAALLPDLPTVSESGYPGFDVSSWYGALAPAGTPRDIIAKINAAIVKGLGNPQVRERMQSQGLDILGSTPEEFARTIREESPGYAKLIKDSGAKAD